MEDLINIGKLGYQWSVSKSQTGHYVCRIWKDWVINKQMKVEMYSAFGKDVDLIIEETVDEFYKVHYPTKITYGALETDGNENVTMVGNIKYYDKLTRKDKLK